MEKRRTKRLPIEVHLEVSRLFRQDHSYVENVNAPIAVTNISKGGIGFITESVLPMGYYFNSVIEFDEKDESKLYCVVKIVRQEEKDGKHEYGCELIGFPSVLEYLFEEYEAKITS